MIEVKVGQVFEKVGDSWIRSSIGEPVVIVKVDGDNVTYRYTNEDGHGLSGGFTKMNFDPKRNEFKLVKDVK